MIILCIIIAIILLIYFSTIKLKVDNLTLSNSCYHKETVAKFQIYAFNKIKIAEIKLKNNKIKTEYIRDAFKKILEKKGILFSKKRIKNFRFIKIKIEKLNYRFNIIFGEGLVYDIEIDFKISLKVRSLILKKV